MPAPLVSPSALQASAQISAQSSAYARALDARDPRFDGIFFVGITTTHIYCRPVCPARISYASHRRFFTSAASAERAGYRPCLRCRPELAPGRAVVDAVPRLANAAARRIAAGALNGRSVADLAHELGVSERHLRRALERALGVSPLELAQTHRLLLAKRLLVDTDLSITRIAYASGFQSLRRFNAAFLEQYRMPPSSLRRPVRAGATRDNIRRVTPNSGIARVASSASMPSTDSRSCDGDTQHAFATEPIDEYLRLTLAYRAPFAWDTLLGCLGGDAVGGIEVVDGRRYGRTVRMADCTGVVFAEDAATESTGRQSTDMRRATHVNVDVSPSLVPVLMPLLARLRHLFDLDAEPTQIDAHLAQSGLAALVALRPGIRIPGTMDGFDIVFRALLRGRARIGRTTAATRMGPQSSDPAARVTWELGEPIDTGIPALVRLAPTAAQIAGAGSAALVALGVPRRRAEAVVAVAQLVADGMLRLEPESADVAATLCALREIAGVGDQATTMIVTRALYWPDALPVSNTILQRAAGVSTPHDLLERAERWRPWRAYAALHLWLWNDARQRSHTA